MLERAKLITAKEAEKQGLYATGQFVLDDEESAYRDGIWLIPAPAAYAEWYQNSAAGMDQLLRRVENGA